MTNPQAEVARHWQRANECMRSGDYAAAIAEFGAIVEIDRAHPMAWFALSSAARASGQFRSAVEHARSAALGMRESGRYDGLNDLAQYLQSLGETRFATHIIERAGWSRVSMHPDEAALLAQCLGLADRHGDALQLLDLALTRHAPTPMLSYTRAMTLRHLGRGAEATAEFERCLALAPDYAAAMLMLAGHDVNADAAGQLARIRAALARAQGDTLQRAMLDYALFIHLDAVGDTSAAWTALAEGMRIKRSSLDWDGSRDQADFTAISALCNADFVNANAVAAAEPSAHTPVFVFGLPRSGTTVLERLLANHSRMASAGELNDFHHQLCWEADFATPDLLDPRLLEACTTIDFGALGQGYIQRTDWRAAGSTHLIDKFPRNFFHAGLIHKALPQAKMICLVRDPLDSCLSNLKELFAGEFYPYSYDPLEAAAHIARFHDLLAHWRTVMPGAIHEIRYEELVRDPARVMRGAIEFCGLPFEPACAELDRNAAPSATASSSQVRQALHSRSIGAWRRYAEPLAGAAALLRERLPAEAFAAPPA